MGWLSDYAEAKCIDVDMEWRTVNPGMVANQFFNPLNKRKREYLEMTEHQHEEHDFGFTGDIGGADKAADRITDSGAYVGKFRRAQFIKAASGAKGIEFEFEAAQGGDARFTVWTVNKDGAKNFGRDQVEALAYLMGVKPEQIKGAVGHIRAYVDGAWKDDVEGVRYPALEGKPIGLVLQKELTTNTNSGKDSYRWNLYGQFDPTSRLTASELREKKTKPEKLEKIVRSCKDKDSREKRAEPAQPSAGAGGYEGI